MASSKRLDNYGLSTEDLFVQIQRICLAFDHSDCICMQPFQILLLKRPVFSLLIQRINLQPEKNSNHNNRDFQSNRKPLLLLNGLGRFPQYHDQTRITSAA